MAVISADELLEQADGLIHPTRGIHPRQAALRRAVSNAYYAAFHTVSVAAADEIAGKVHQRSSTHRLVVQSIDHAAIKRVCVTLVGPIYPPLYKRYCTPDHFGAELRRFMDMFPLLQQERHRADYDSEGDYTVAMSAAWITSARTAIGNFWLADVAERNLFLFLILFPPKR